MKLSLDDVIKSDYSRNIMRIFRHIQDLEDSGELERYEISSPDHIGNGAAGAVYNSTDPNCVIKVTFEDADLDSANHFIGHKLKHIANIMGIKSLKLPEDSKKLHFIKMEKLNNFDDDTSGFLDSFLGPLFAQIQEESEVYRNKHTQKLSKRILREISYFYKENKHRLSPSEKSALRNLSRFLKDVHRSGYHFHDRQVSQFMKSKSGQIKLVDLGAIRKNR